VPVWRLGDDGEPPWLLRQFDRIRFVPVTAAELDRYRSEIIAGSRDLDTKPARFSLADVAALETNHATEISLLRSRRQVAFEAERDRWVAAT
jgi:urea carboxylase